MGLNKKKGVALLTALIFMTIIISISMLLFTILIGGRISNKYEISRLNRLVEMENITQDFINENLKDDYDYSVRVFASDDDANIKAVVVKAKTANDKNISYYCIYNFSTKEILAKQNQNFDLTKKEYMGEEYYYLSNIVRYVKVQL